VTAIAACAAHGEAIFWPASKMSCGESCGDVDKQPQALTQFDAEAPRRRGATVFEQVNCSEQPPPQS
jgi:hypothetical protein